MQNRRQRYIILATLLVVTLYNTGYLCLIIFQCTPIDHAWKPFKKGHCLSGKINTSTSYAHAALTGFTDLVFAVLPIFVVWDLKMNTAMKVSVSGLLGLGAIGGITSFIRMPYISALEKATPIDFFVVTYRLAIWTCVEPGVGITVGSLATLRPLFRKVIYLSSSSLFGSYSVSHSTSHATSKPYLRRNSNSNPSPSPYLLNNLNLSSPLSGASGTKKAGIGVTTTIVEGTLTKNGRSWCGSKSKLESASSQEDLGRSASESGSREGIGIAVTTERVVEFEAIVNTSNNRAAVTPNPTREEPFVGRGGFY